MTHLGSKSSNRVEKMHWVAGSVLLVAAALFQRRRTLRGRADRADRADVDRHSDQGLRIGIIGFGRFGQFIAKTFLHPTPLSNNSCPKHLLWAASVEDCSAEAAEMGCEAFYAGTDEGMQLLINSNLDVIVVSVSILSFEEVVRSLPAALTAGKLVVDVLSVKQHAKTVLLQHLPSSSGILCLHPMFGPDSGKHGWRGLPVMYESASKVTGVAGRFLRIFLSEGCRLLPMTCDEHDHATASSQFITHLIGRVLSEATATVHMQSTPLDTVGFTMLRGLVANTCRDSFDLFSGLYAFNAHSGQILAEVKRALHRVEERLESSSSGISSGSSSSSNNSGIGNSRQ
eukprot:GSChrysophyteH2.ASY1.ANO1.936.1 assembled CDS